MAAQPANEPGHVTEHWNIVSEPGETVTEHGHPATEHGHPATEHGYPETEHGPHAKAVHIQYPEHGVHLNPAHSVPHVPDEPVPKPVIPKKRIFFHCKERKFNTFWLVMAILELLFYIWDILFFYIYILLKNKSCFDFTFIPESFTYLNILISMCMLYSAIAFLAGVLADSPVYQTSIAIGILVRVFGMIMVYSTMTWKEWPRLKTEYIITLMRGVYGIFELGLLAYLLVYWYKKKKLIELEKEMQAPTDGKALHWVRRNSKERPYEAYMARYHSGAALSHAAIGHQHQQKK